MPFVSSPFFFFIADYAIVFAPSTQNDPPPCPMLFILFPRRNIGAADQAYSEVLEPPDLPFF